MAIFLIFQNGGHPPSWIKKIEILIICNLKRVKMHHCTKFHDDSMEPLLSYGDLTIFPNGGHRPS